MREEIVVQSDSQRVAGDASIGANFRAPLLEKLPGPRDIRAAVQLSPNVNSLGPRNALISIVRWRTKSSRTLCSISTDCWSTVLTATKRIVGRVTASAIAAASAASVLPRFTYGLT